MSARLMVPVYLLIVGAAAGSSELATTGSRDVFVHLGNQGAVSPTVIDAMRQETSALMQTGGYRVRWLDHPREVTAAFLVMVKLDGRCATDSSPKVRSKILASAVVEDGHILPFVNVNCTALQSLLASVAGPNRTPQVLYGRAIGRLLAHELYHVVGQTKGHTRTGVSQAALSVRELISDHFAFGMDALEKLRLPAASIGSLSESLFELDAQ